MVDLPTDDEFLELLRHCTPEQLSLIQDLLVQQFSPEYEDLLIQEYLYQVTFIKNQGEKLSKEEQLKRLLPPLLLRRKLAGEDIERFITPEGEEDGNVAYPFTHPVFCPKEELDLEKLNKGQYEILGQFNSYDNSVRYDGSSRIFFNPGIEEKIVDRDSTQSMKWILKRRESFRIIEEMTLEDYFSKIWLPKLNQEIMKSRDLLDQICVVYAIKRAQNGDKKAIEKLVNLYRGMADALAVSFAEKRKLDIEEVKDTALMLLWNLIEGDRSEALIKWLTTPNTKESYWGIQTRKAKDIFLEYLLNYLPGEINKILAVSNKYNSLKELPNLGHEIRPDLEEIRLGAAGSMMSSLLDPFSIINKDTKLNKAWGHVFNNYCFRPEKGTNLTIWLFGAENWPQYGKVFQRLRDYYDRVDKRRKKKQEEPEGFDAIDGKNVTAKGRKKPVKPLDEYSDDEYSNDLEHCSIEGYSSNEDEGKRSDNNDIGLSDKEAEMCLRKIIDFLKSQGIPQRNIEIFSKKVEGSSYPKLARESGLSHRRIEQIIKELRALLRRKLHTG